MPGTNGSPEDIYSLFPAWGLRFSLLVCGISEKWVECQHLLFVELALRIRRDFPGDTGVKEHVCQFRTCKGCVFDPWVGKIPWRRKWQPTLILLPG